MPLTLTLHAEDADDLTAVDAAQPLTADAEARTLTGIVAPYGVYGYTSAGRVKIRAGAITVPADLSRVKLLEHHTNPAHPPRAVGVAIHAEDTETGLRMTFRIASTPAGDEALTAAAEQVKDAFSVELARVRTHRDEVLAGSLTAVAHVPLPAYADSRIESVAASHHEGETPMTAEQRARLTELRAKDTLSQDEAAELSQLAIAEQADSDAGQDDAAGADETDSSASGTSDSGSSGGDGGGTVDAAARRPNTLTAATSDSHAVGTLGDLFASLAAVHNGERSPELTAALEDVAYSSSPFASQPEYVGELWDGVEYQRKFTELLRQHPLTSLRAKGYRWIEEPDVDDWAGDKSDVPSNEVSWEEVEFTAKRLAGAHDLAREYWDFGDTEAINAFFRKQAENYKKRTDRKALDAILAAATGTTGVVGSILRAAATAANEVETLTDGQEATAILVNNADWLGLLDITGFDVPAYLRDVLHLEPGNFRRSSHVPAGQVVALAKPAMRWRELPGVPIRVTAEHIARGGRDTGLFGYWMTMTDNPDGIRKVTFEAPATPTPNPEA